jgi:hypothetical protein
MFFNVICYWTKWTTGQALVQKEEALVCPCLQVVYHICSYHWCPEYLLKAGIEYFSCGHRYTEQCGVFKEIWHRRPDVLKIWYA